MHWYDWSKKSIQEREEYKKKSQLKICPECKNYPCIGDKYLDVWVCIDCGAIRKKEKEESKEATSL